MHLGKAFSFPFEDKEWPAKLGLYALIFMVPVLNFASLGYTVEVTRRVIRGETRPLPSWDDLGKKFMDGLMLFLVNLVYTLPMILLICLPLSILFVSAVLFAMNNSREAASTIAIAGGVVGLGVWCVWVLYSLALSIVFPVIQLVYARQGTFAACFNFREIFSLLGKNAASIFTTWAVYDGLVIGFSIVAIPFVWLTSWIPCLGSIVGVMVPLAGIVYFLLVFAHLIGQVGAMQTGSS